MFLCKENTTPEVDSTDTDCEVRTLTVVLLLFWRHYSCPALHRALH